MGSWGCGTNASNPNRATEQRARSSPEDRVAKEGVP